MKYTSSIPKLAGRLRDVSPSVTLALAQKARDLASGGDDVVSLTAGEPDFFPPAHIVEATRRAAEQGLARYTHVAGLAELREAIRARIRDDDALEYEINEIIVSSGAKQALYNAIMCLVDEGNEVLLVAPYYLSYRDMVHLAGGTPVVIDTLEENGFAPAAEQIAAAITPRTRVLVLNSPSNPAGAAYGEAELRSIADVLRRHPEVAVISDEIYRRFSYGPEPFTSLLRVAPDLQDRVLLVGGCSKSYAMTGYRIGWAAGPRNLVSAMSRVQGQSTSNPCTLSQYAAIAALSGDQSWVDEMVEAFDVRRRFVVGRLRALPGLTCYDPKGAFYAFPSFASYVGRRLPDDTEVRDAFTITAYLLHEHHLVLVPGKPFGAPLHIRLSFAADMDTLSRGLDRLQAALTQIR